MASPEAEFLEAIAAEPNGWSARSVFADWLEGKGRCARGVDSLESCSHKT